VLINLKNIWISFDSKYSKLKHKQDFICPHRRREKSLMQTNHSRIWRGEGGDKGKIFASKVFGNKKFCSKIFVSKTVSSKTFACKIFGTKIFGCKIPECSLLTDKF
jgi:hypothetical protein